MLLAPNPSEQPSADDNRMLLQTHRLCLSSGKACVETKKHVQKQLETSKNLLVVQMGAVVTEMRVASMK
jgi:hypothetical protein